MQRIFIIIGIIIFLAFIVGSNAFFVVKETEQVVVTQFGDPIRKPIQEAGLYFKIPFIQKANYFDKRILEWDGKRNQIPTEDKRYIWIDTTARWKIVEPLTFLQSVTNEAGAQARLDDIISSVTRDVITSRKLLEVVRTSDRLKKKLKKEKAIIERKEIPEGKAPIKGKRLTKSILEKSKGNIREFGIELVDVRIKRLNYAKQVRKRVYDRMISERERVAEKYRSEGEGRKAEIEGRMQRDLKEIQSKAYQKAQNIKGKADAKAINIYAQAYRKDPSFYSFLKTLDTYKNTIDSKTTIFLTTDSEYYNYLKRIEGVKHMPKTTK